MMIKVLFRLVLLLSFSLVAAAEYEQRPADFVRESFVGQSPKPALVWLSGDLRQQVTRVLGHAPDYLRLRYWHKGERSVWILNEIGKERPITLGVSLLAGRVERVKVLAFRESRGWEVRYPFFTDQFKGVGLQPDLQLDQRVDGITGATLSVRAVSAMVKLALLLDARVSAKHGT